MKKTDDDAKVLDVESDAMDKKKLKIDPGVEEEKKIERRSSHWRGKILPLRWGCRGKGYGDGQR